MQSAAGGTSQRLKPAVAIVRSLSRKPAPAPEMVPALLIDVIDASPAAALCGLVCRPRSCFPQAFTEPVPSKQFRVIQRRARIAKRVLEPKHPMLAVMPAATQQA